MHLCSLLEDEIHYGKDIMMSQKQFNHVLLRCLMSLSVFLFLLEWASVPMGVHAEAVQRSSTGNTLYLQSTPDVQLPDHYQMGYSIPSGSGVFIPPRAYWLSPPVSTPTTFASGAWNFSVHVQVNVSPSINIYSLIVVSSATGNFLREISGPISRRYNALGGQDDVIHFSAQAQSIGINERIETYYITPNWCTAAPIQLGTNTFLQEPVRL